MTALLIDYYKGEVFVHSDGIVVTDEWDLMDDTYEKSIYLSNGDIFVGCGSIGLLEEIKELLKTNNFDFYNKLKSKANGDMVVVNKDKAIIGYYRFDKEKNKLNVTINTHNFRNRPKGLGSGGRYLLGAWYALNPRKAKNRNEYLKIIKQVFNAAKKGTTSITELTHTKSIKD
jgi:hypothetical protein